MQQLSLIPQAGVRVLVDDDTGRITYTPALFAADVALDWFERLRAQTPWRSERRFMYDRMVDVPRLVASFALDATAVPEPILLMRPAVERVCRVRFTSAGLNYYRDGNDSVAPHGDHVEEMASGAPVALVSLGATRRMTIRSKARPRRVLDLDLAAGSLLVMSYDSQFTYDHGVPKTKDAVGPRISVAFRRTVA